MSKKLTQDEIANTYKHLNDIEHILLKPGMWIGTIEKDKESHWVYNDEKESMTKCELNLSPALYKIFDEILVNAYDRTAQILNDPTSKIWIDIDSESITIKNNGSTVPIDIHEEFGIYLPEFVFGKVKTSTNYNDNDGNRYTGGTFGIGSKATNIWSKKFIVSLRNAEYKKSYYQVFKNNLSDIGKPTIKDYKGVESFTSIKFFPDLERFGMDKLDDDIILLMERRCYDIAMACNNNLINNDNKKKVSVYLNGQRIKTTSFKDYASLYLPKTSIIAIDKPNDYWQIGIATSNNEKFQCVSFVNGINPHLGGKHVDHVKKQIVSAIKEKLKKKFKDDDIKDSYIENCMFLFINCMIDKPTFLGQTKAQHSTAIKNFGSKYEINDKFIKQILKNGLENAIMEIVNSKKMLKTKNALSSSKKADLSGIVKLKDANWAGTKKSLKTTLILAEGDSAKALVINGISAVTEPYNGNDIFGVLPLKGKLLNVRNTKYNKIIENEEIKNIIEILGLKFDKEYTASNIKELRYGHLMIFTDADTDGSHITGLIINFIQCYWPSLLKINGFIQNFITPVVVATRSHGKKKYKEVFYSLPDFEKWKISEEYNKYNWETKYYKGLGTSTKEEAKIYFKNLATHIINFKYDNTCEEKLDLAFDKNRADDRKVWINSKNTDDLIDYNDKVMQYSDFIDKELVLHSIDNIERNIPSLLDGLKTSQRKILYACNKRNLTKDVKVAQLSGYIAEHAAYHHGETSLQKTVISMAQDFVGSNNINLLVPSGQFGTRANNGEDHAAARYIFTRLNDITNIIFNKLDEPLLDYNTDDDMQIEPFYYVPIIPMLLVNGCHGLGTGWSSHVPNYSPMDVINNIKLKLAGKKMKNMIPWYRNFAGQILKNDKHNFISKGMFNIEVKNSTYIIHITELPIGTWTDEYKANVLVKLKNEGFISNIFEQHTDIGIHFIIELTCKPDELPNKIKGEKDALSIIENVFKLSTSKFGVLTNIHAFDRNKKIKKYDSPLDVINEFYDIRLEFYDKRRDYMLEDYLKQIDDITERIKFILMIVIDELDDKTMELIKDKINDNFIDISEIKTLKIKNIKKSDLLNELNNRGFKNSEKLITMSLINLTHEKIITLINERKDTITLYNDLLEKNKYDLWKEDLEELSSFINKHYK